MNELPELGAAGVRYDRVGDVATVTLDRADRRNAQTPQMWRAMAAIGAALPGDVRIVVVRGVGTTFSSGLETAMFGTGLPGEPTAAEIAAMPTATADALLESYQDAFSWLGRSDIVSIAAVQGHAIGAGAQLALSCDLRVLADDALLSLPEATFGLVPDLGGTWPLVRAVGYATALEIALTGRRLAAPEARARGLANIVVPRDELDAAVADLVAVVLGTDRTAATELKVLLSGALGRTAQEQRAAEREAQVRRLKNAAGIGD